MQNLIAIILLLLAIGFLLLKWLPKSAKNKIAEIDAGRFPALTPLLNQLNKGSSGCSSGCNACSSNIGNTCSSPEIKPIKLIRLNSTTK